MAKIHPSLCLIFVVLSTCIHAAERESDGAYSPDERKHSIHRHQHKVDDDAEAHHQAIIGDEKLHQEIHRSSPEQAKERLLKLAAEHDKDNDSRISMEELQAWIYKSFKNLNEADALERFREADKDLDEFVTWTEHLVETWGLADGENGLDTEDMKDELPIIKEEKLLFEAADRNGDGKLSVEEYVIFERPEEYEFMQPLIIQRTKEAKDKNGDGFIDFHEYIIDILPNFKGEDKETYFAEKERFDQHYDQDKDGKLNDDEIIRWLIPDDKASAAAEADHIMEKSDADKDGSLSFEEILKNQDAFVGSEITDYGNALNTDGVVVEDEHDEL